ncbi:DNA-binding transcriptional MocR family regulator [Pullulanibacillus pueri]|uniref:GntR family transcriptional regulator n=1 Tax=Pullulanibacillus pueri TaxID=1437324 RepID=A0A8J2ZUR7_9BACL|nr:PLP-dependent aminotransferase family protein [Pullulanibacillus pueri]MBM7681242.1 DNA-binding transcriptional MocR family regulator [Pullulanibacillus pueri]GGH77911.1 GntR family transcriptional regulator [Pullulanibacillus pueri]
MRLTIDKHLPTPVYKQIKDAIKEKILSGLLPAGFILPPERRLANINDVSRSTVIKAYDELKALGLVKAHRGKGTIVAEKTEPENPKKNKQVFPLSWHPLFEKKMHNISDTISDMINTENQREMISLAAGIGDPQLFPIQTLQTIQSDRVHHELFNFCAVEGYYPLREHLSQLMTLRNIVASAKEIMILSGSMQGIDFAARTFLSPGDAVIVEEPTFLQAIQRFKAAGAKIIGIPLDKQGLRTDILEAQLARYKPKFIYTIPSFHNPTGTVMSMERRLELLDLAYKFQVPILEDDPYGELNFTNDKPLPLHALDHYGYVIYLSTFSKVLFPGMRVGWVVAPEPILKKFAILKQISDLHVNTPAQVLLNRFLEDGHFEPHLNHIKPIYKARRDIMLSVLKQSEDATPLIVPEGGFYLWCKLPTSISQKELFALCAAKGVSYIPGHVFYPQQSDGEQFIRLNFTHESHQKIKKGTEILLESVSYLKSHGKHHPMKRESRPIV